MFGSSAAPRRVRRTQRLLIGLQVLFLLFSLTAPVGTIAVEPPVDNPSAEPSGQPSIEPSAEPSAEPTTAPDPTATPRSDS